MKEAINKAIEGGWKYKRNDTQHFLYQIAIGEILEEDYNDILLDPVFWQCLGKSLKWGIANGICPKCCYTGENGWLISNPVTCPKCHSCRGDWLFFWHRFVDYIGEGGNTEEFFINLLNQNK